MQGRPRPGERLGTYRIEHALGAGGTGAVFAARDELLDRPVALKLLHVHSEESLIGEARALAALDHPNVVRVYGLERIDGRAVVVMQLVEGRSLADVVRQQGPLAPGAAAEVVRAVAAALDAVHRGGRVHGDVKPSNILREDRTGRVLLTDFGLARAIDVAERPAFVRGTPGYLAPEQATGACVARELRARADVYSLAVTAFELLTGRLPFEHGDTRELLRLQVHTDAPPPSAFRQRLPWRIDRALSAALHRFPEGRTDSAARLASDLSAAVSAGHSPPRVLVADDDVEYRALIAHGLTKRLGRVVVESVPDGERAYHAARSRPPDLAVIDLAMPGLNGLELAAALLSSIGLERLPIIVLSGRAGERERALLERIGVAVAFDKPVPMWKLAAAARQLLGSGPRGSGPRPTLRPSAHPRRPGDGRGDDHRSRITGA